MRRTDLGDHWKYSVQSIEPCTSLTISVQLSYCLCVCLSVSVRALSFCRCGSVFHTFDSPLAITVHLDASHISLKGRVEEGTRRFPLDVRWLSEVSYDMEEVTWTRCVNTRVKRGRVPYFRVKSKGNRVVDLHHIPNHSPREL